MSQEDGRVGRRPATAADCEPAARRRDHQHDRRPAATGRWAWHQPARTVRHPGRVPDSDRVQPPARRPPRYRQRRCRHSPSRPPSAHRPGPLQVRWQSRCQTARQHRRRAPAHARRQQRRRPEQTLHRTRARQAVRAAGPQGGAYGDGAGAQTRARIPSPRRTPPSQHLGDCRCRHRLREPMAVAPTASWQAPGRRRLRAGRRRANREEPPSRQRDGGRALPPGGRRQTSLTRRERRSTLGAATCRFRTSRKRVQSIPGARTAVSCDHGTAPQHPADRASRSTAHAESRVGGTGFEPVTPTV